jgi:hypothetical protein
MYSWLAQWDMVKLTYEGLLQLSLLARHFYLNLTLITNSIANCRGALAVMIKVCRNIGLFTSVASDVPHYNRIWSLTQLVGGTSEFTSVTSDHMSRGILPPLALIGSYVMYGLRTERPSTHYFTGHIINQQHHQSISSKALYRSNWLCSTGCCPQILRIQSLYQENALRKASILRARNFIALSIIEWAYINHHSHQ